MELWLLILCFVGAEVSHCTEDVPTEAQNADETQIGDDETLPVKRKKASKERKIKKERNSSETFKENRGGKKSKSKKSSKRLKHKIADDDDES